MSPASAVGGMISGFAVVASTALAPGCSGGGATLPREAAGANLLLVTLDSTRPDALGCYGGKGVETPHLDRLAREGVRFECVISASPLTLPSHATLLTGSYPIQHGVRGDREFHLGEDASTLAELLKAKGFATAAIVASSTLESGAALSQGFDSYDDEMPIRGDSDRIVAGERRASQVTDAAVAFLDRQKDDRPFFLWLHYHDPHDPYSPPSPFFDRYSGSDRRRYDGEVASMDAEIGRLLDSVSTRPRRTLTVVVADHGEAFGERDELFHGLFLYDTTTRVPMILHAPGILPAGRTIAPLVRTADLVPTLAEVYGFSVGSAVHGESMLDLVLSEKGSSGREAYVETFLPQLDFGWAALRSLRTDSFQFVAAPEAEYYDLRSDPAEVRNVAANLPEDREVARARLQDLIERHSSPEGRAFEKAAIDSELENRLTAVVGGSEVSSASRERGFGDDPKGHVGLYSKLALGKSLLASGEVASAITVFEGLAAEEPGNGRVEQGLGHAYVLGDRLEDAERVFRRAVDRSPGSAEARCDLAALLLRRGKIEQAESIYAKSVASSPSHGLSHYGWALCLERLSREDEAIIQYRLAAQCPGSLPQWRLGLVHLLLLQKKTGEAVNELKSVVAAYPRFDLAVAQLGMLALSMGDLNQAVESLEQACRLGPSNLNPYGPLASAYDRLGQTARAFEVMRRAEKLDPENAGMHCQFAELASKSDAGEGTAVSHYRRAIELDPASVERYQAMRKEAPGSSKSQFCLGLAYYELGKLEQALALVSAAAAGDPKNPRARDGVGQLLFQLKRHDEAAATFRKILEESPDRPSSLNELAWILATCEDASFRKPEEAIRLAERAVSLSPSDTNFLDTLAKAYDAAGDRDKAREVIRKALAMKPDDPMLKSRLEEFGGH